MEDSLKEDLKRLFPADVLFDESMSKHSTIGIGGVADAFIIVSSEQRLQEIVSWAVEHSVQYYIWGNGSNTLVKDGGIRGLVIKLSGYFNFIEVEGEVSENFCVNVGASVLTPRFVDWTVEHGFGGVEFLWGIPGTIGGNIITNAGSDNKDVSMVLQEIKIIEKNTRKISIKRNALDFGVRRLKLPRSTVVIGAKIGLYRSNSQKVREKIDLLKKLREDRQPIGERSLGCVFKNPHKQSAGALIDDAGLKGVRVGKARVSTKHANFIINEGDANAREVIVLMNLMKEKVREKLNIVLEPEIFVIGDDE